MAPAPPEGLILRRTDGSVPGAAPGAAERAMVLRLQQTAGNASVARLLRQVAPPATEETEEAQAAAGFLVADDAEPAAGQMRHGEFLDTVEAEVTAAAEAKLSALWLVAGCPWIQHWVAHYRERSPEETQAAVQRYGRVSSRADASEAIAAVRARVERGIEEWQQTGEMPPEAAGAAQPAGGPAAAPGLAGAGEVGVALKARPGASPGAADARAVRSALGRGRPMESSVRDRMSRALGEDVGDVRVHDDPGAGRLAGAMGARAMAVGRHVAFAPNEYAPGTPLGDGLIAHELAHVLQQRGGGAELGRTSALEGEADAMAVQAVTALHIGQGAPARPSLRRSLSAGLQMQSCAGPQAAGPTTATPGPTSTPAGSTPASGIEDAPSYTAAAAGDENKMDATALQIHALFNDTKKSVEARAVDGVKMIIANYFASESAKVAEVVHDASIDPIETESVGSGADTKGKIKVGPNFVTLAAKQRNIPRLVMSVGHEIMHINQYRSGKGGSDRKEEREFLASHWTATAPEVKGTGRMTDFHKNGAIERALKSWKGMTAAQQKTHQAKHDELVALQKTLKP